MPIVRPFPALRLSPDRIDISATNPIPETLPAPAAAAASVYLRDPEPCFYIYRMIRDGHEQTGIVAAVNVDGYDDGTIKRHELIRPAKVDVQVRLIDEFCGNIEPTLLTYDSVGRPLPGVRDYAKAHAPLYDFAGEDDTIHQIWAIDDGLLTEELQLFFRTVEALYICDGHHRIAASAAYAKRSKNPRAQYFMAAIFPSEEMLILDFNRAVTDLNGLSKAELLEKLRAASFETECVGNAPYRPAARGEFAMVLDDEWYRLRYTGERDASDPVVALDVSVLQDRILGPILGIDDPTHDERITFLRAMRGLAGLQAMTHRGMKVAFATFPVTMREIHEVADCGLTMPPKSTCFEPKPVQNLLIHTI